MNNLKYDFAIIFDEVEKYKRKNPDQTFDTKEFDIDVLSSGEINKLVHICHEIKEQKTNLVSFHTFS